MPTLTMTKGLPGSGKSTWARCQPGKRVNKDDLRAMLDSGKWSKSNEKFILAVRDQIISSALQRGQNVIVDDTNLDPKHEETLRQLAKIYSADFHIQDFTHVPLKDCIERDLARDNSVGEKVIKEMYYRYLYKSEPAPEYKYSLINCVLVDIDGTVAQMDGRGPYEWDKVNTDLPKKHVIEVIKAVLRGSPAEHLVFLSGRDESCAPQTQQWLKNYFTDYDFSLYMRPHADTRNDAVVKRELYEKYVKPFYNVSAIFDDRSSVARLWDSLGFGDRLFRVGPVDRDDF